MERLEQYNVVEGVVSIIQFLKQNYSQTGDHYVMLVPQEILSSEEPVLVRQHNIEYSFNVSSYSLDNYLIIFEKLYAYLECGQDVESLLDTAIEEMRKEQENSGL